MLLGSVAADGYDHDLLGLAGFTQAQGFLQRDLVEGVYAHLDAVGVHAAAVGEHEIENDEIEALGAQDVTSRREAIGGATVMAEMLEDLERRRAPRGASWITRLRSRLGRTSLSTRIVLGAFAVVLAACSSD